MGIYDFTHDQRFSNLDQVPDHRSDAERLNSALSLHNQNNPDIGYSERLAEEVINLAGAWVKVFKRTRASADDLWEEDPDPTYKNGIMLKGRFIQVPVETQQTRHGLDSPNQLVIQFSRANVFKLFNSKMISEGDIIIIPTNTLTVTQDTDLRSGPGNRMNSYRVLKSAEAGPFRYRWLYWNCTVENILGDKTIEVPFK